MASQKRIAAPVSWVLKTKHHTAGLASTGDGFVCATNEGAAHHVTLDGTVSKTLQLGGDVLHLCAEGAKVWALVDGSRIVDLETEAVALALDVSAESFAVRNGRFYVQHDAGLIAFEDGRVVWQREAERGGTVAVDEQAVFFGQTQGLERLSFEGQRQWLAPAQYVHRVAIGPRGVWGLSYRGTRVYGANDGAVLHDRGDGFRHVTLNAAGDAFCIVESVVGEDVVTELISFDGDGTVQWRFPSPLQYVEALRVVGERLIVTSALGQVCCVDISPTGIAKGLAGKIAKPLQLKPVAPTGKKPRGKKTRT